MRFQEIALLGVLAAVVACGPVPEPVQHQAALSTTLVSTGATWRYLADGSNQGTTWRNPGFDDTAWPSGPAQLGYGDGDEATVVPYGPDSANKYITTYFRKSFSVSDPTAFAGLSLRLLRDDGAVVYLNGVEVVRSNLPTGTISSTSLASVAVSGADETTFYSFSVSPTLLSAGVNLLAVELHQSGGTSSDLSFDLDLVGNSGATVTRGPYLQSLTDRSLIVRWRSDVATDSRVRYGVDPANLNLSADVAGAVTEHVVQLSGLSPAATYYYTVGSTTQTQAGDLSYRFTTAPSPGQSRPSRIWVLGDSGTADANARAVRDAFATYTGARGADLLVMLGDNAYNSGTDTEYQSAVFDMYPSWLRQTTLWPTLGNHDGQSADSATQTGPYYNIFSLPKAAEAGGVASGTEAYYSFNYGNIHFVCLDSYETSRAPGGAMLTWLSDDLLSNSALWTVVFFHHPPYSKGSHDSDVDIEMVQMRQNVLPILEQHGVDLVLTGHSHAYERSYLIDGHYGLSSTFVSSMKKDGGSGRVDGTGAYRKATLGPASHEGAVYVVAGSSGQASGGALNHPAMFISLNQLGSMVLDVDGDRLDAKFVTSTSTVTDYFTMRKGGICVEGAACDDGNPCTQTDVCTGGLCVGGNPKVCTALDQCHVAGVCDPASGQCSNPNQADGTSCNDGNTCTSGEICQAGSCGGGTPSCDITVEFREGALPSAAYTGASDTYLSQSAPTSTLGAATLVQVSGDSPAGSRQDLVGLLRFDLSSLPTTARVTAVSLSINAQGASQGYEIYQCKRDFVEGQATWQVYATGKSWQKAGAKGGNDRGTTVLGTLAPAAAGQYTLSLNASGVALVQSWIANPATNQGLVVANTNNKNTLAFGSGEAATLTNRPRLSVTYR